MSDERRRLAYHVAGHMVAARYLTLEEHRPLPLVEGAPPLSFCERLDAQARQIDNQNLAGAYLVIISAGWIAAGMAGATKSDPARHMPGEEHLLNVLHGTDDTPENVDRAEESLLGADAQAKKLLQDHWPKVEAQAELFLTDPTEWARWGLAEPSFR